MVECNVCTDRRVRIVYRGLGRAFVVHKNRDLEGSDFLAALGLVYSDIITTWSGSFSVDS
jgi:hypothetical protein